MGGVRRRRTFRGHGRDRAHAPGGRGAVRCAGRQPGRVREHQAGQSGERVGHLGRREHLDPGVRDRHQRRPRADRSGSRSTPPRRRTASTSTGWATTAAWAPGRWPRSRRAAISNQPNCLNDVATGLIDCGNWTQNASWSVPTDAVSGHLLRQAGPHRRDRRFEPHPVRRPRRQRRARTCCSRPPTRPGRPTTPTAATASTPAPRPVGPTR